jgi:hypothetical protein
LAFAVPGGGMPLLVPAGAAGTGVIAGFGFALVCECTKHPATIAETPAAMIAAIAAATIRVVIDRFAIFILQASSFAIREATLIARDQRRRNRSRSTRR